MCPLSDPDGTLRIARDHRSTFKTNDTRSLALIVRGERLACRQECDEAAGRIHP